MKGLFHGAGSVLDRVYKGFMYYFSDDKKK